MINLTDILTGYDPLTDAISDFVQLVNNGANTEILVDSDGGADAFVAIASIQGGISETIDDLMTNGNLVVDTSVVV